MSGKILKGFEAVQEYMRVGKSSVMTFISIGMPCRKADNGTWWFHTDHIDEFIKKFTNVNYSKALKGKDLDKLDLSD